MTFSQDIHWDATYDVVVLGFGGAGATAARFAADDGAKVLLVDSAPEGREGGNTRVSAQLVCCANDEDAMRKHYRMQQEPMCLDDDVIDTYVAGLASMKDYFRKYLDVEEPYQTKANVGELIPGATAEQVGFWPEYPEFEGGHAVDMLTVHKGFFDSALWKILHQKVLDRSDQIDVWYRSPACHLIKGSDNKTILGVQIEREHVVRNVRALNGVVLTTGGFENNPRMIQDYIGAPKLIPLGGTYNMGIGITLALEAGADLWHLTNYEGLGMQHGLTFPVPEGEHGPLLMLGYDEMNEGSLITVAPDGSRYFREDEGNRHGHIYDHGIWKVPAAKTFVHLVFDQAKHDEIAQGAHADFLGRAVSAPSVKELAAQIGADPDIFSKTIKNFNTFVELGEDFEYGRSIDTMRAFDDGPYYAIKMGQTVLNTQGGPRRNSRAEIVDPQGDPIPYLYGAGELGGVSAGHYQAGQNLAECLIFGKIAGQNAATVKPRAVVSISGSSAGTTQSTAPLGSLGSDLGASIDIAVGPNQYLGRSQQGIGSELVVRVTTNDTGDIEDIEIVKQSETEVADDALKKLPQEMVARNTADVDAVSGASATSRALKDAVKDALSHVPGRHA